MAYEKIERRTGGSGSAILIIILLAVSAFQSYYIYTGHWPSWSEGFMSKFTSTAHKESVQIHNNISASPLNPSNPTPSARSTKTSGSSDQEISDDVDKLKNTVNHVFTQSVQTMQDFVNSKGVNISSATADPNLHEEADHYTLSVDLPNADKSTINVNVDGRILTISGNSQKTVNQNQTSESQSQSFLRSVLLPPLADSTKVQAKYDNQILTVTIPKLAEPSSGTQVQVQ